MLTFVGFVAYLHLWFLGLLPSTIIVYGVCNLMFFALMVIAYRVGLFLWLLLHTGLSGQLLIGFVAVLKININGYLMSHFFNSSFCFKEPQFAFLLEK